ncbi:DUF1349 domain-containing protein [Nonomuraea diastatica]|uniref:DUF1349 domain-containing protein n=1 Tax=Nonomuraea diastatica TaxID=1848329 RepID=UPI001FEB251B|nr:DUF1349 domain-containing protein [Nonomuraea diastatica]
MQHLNLELGLFHGPKFTSHRTPDIQPRLGALTRTPGSWQGDLLLSVTFNGDYAERYDQAGAVLRIGEHHWIKANVEYVDGGFHLSTVVTREFSGWSVLPLGRAAQRVTFTLERAVRFSDVRAEGC